LLIVLNILSCREKKAKEPSWQGSGRSNEPFVLEEREVQQAESTGWGSILWGTAAALGALFLVDRALSQNRDNQ